MNTPIVDFVKKYANEDISRFHMPGHKGCNILGLENIDITEINGADVLYNASGIINESENNASSLFKTMHSFYSTQGSTLAIMAMLGIIKKCSENDDVMVIAARNVHKAFVNAAALLDLDVRWVYSKRFSHICTAKITADDIEFAIRNAGKKPNAVFVTSIDYLGQTLDIASIASICNKHSIPLLVDNAHGAYLAFSENLQHPIHCGADMCCDSAHKTLPVLTGGAYLHISKNTDAKYLECSRAILSIFASTSPSYLILQSLDLCNLYLEKAFPNDLEDCIAKTDETKTFIKSKGFFVLESEKLKIVIDTKKSGYYGNDLADILRKYKIEAEFADDDFLVLMTSPKNSEIDFLRLNEAFSDIGALSPIDASSDFEYGLKSESCMSIRRAMFSKHKTVNVKESFGKICASPLISCPPAVPIVISGERITKDAIMLFKKYGINFIDIVDE